MKSPFSTWKVLLAAIIVGTTACASSGGGGGSGAADAAAPDANSVRLAITNDVVPPALITVWIVPEGGTRRRLGTVPPNGRRTFNYTPALRSNDHHFVAEVELASQEKTSNPFTMEDASTIRWSAMSQFIRRER